ncbi:MAG TPA: amine dehydrogenase large subunit [Phenylobacterium sp.]|jgi:methylamine dehydrogenase heavy chain
MSRKLFVAAWLGVAALGGPAAAAQPTSTALPIEELGHIAALPERYPASWVLADYIAEPSVSESKTEVLEITDHGAVLKGQVPTHQLGVTLASPVRPEIYVAETFYARGERGARTDVITIYDTQTLTATGEIVLPGAKRGLFVKQPASFALTNGGRWGLVFNFTPASSVTVVDLVGRKVLGEVATPGCAQIFPTGSRGFSSLCANGTLLSFQLDAAGKPVSQRESAPFNPLDSDPLFLAPAAVSGVSYFPSLGGRVQPIDFRPETPAILPAWSLVDDKLAAQHWRPSGLQLSAGDTQKLYVLMRPNAEEGSHKEGGAEVWVFDPATHARTARLKLKHPARSVMVTSAQPSRLLAIGVAGALDVYDTAGGGFITSSTVPALGGALLRPAQ